MRIPWLVSGDIDGFFGLFSDNLIQLLLIAVLCETICGFPPELVYAQILPGAALSILAGNLFYTYQARRLMRQAKRLDVTALPYGINTPSVFAYVLLIMGPIYRETGSYQLAWQAGLFACFLSGVLETIGAFVGDWLRRNTPRAALLTALAGIAVTFISMGFAFQIFASPAVAILPMFIILIGYASNLKLPGRIPIGLMAIIIGTALAWTVRLLNGPAPGNPFSGIAFGWHLPQPVPGDLLALLLSPWGWKYLAIIIPMGLFNVVGSIQNLESAEVAGDRFETRPALLANGIGSLLAAFFGSAFPTTIYIGHPGWKALGARAGYSALNGAVITALCLTGAVALVGELIPMEAVIGILIWVGILITAQAFSEVPRRQTVAVAFGLIPALSAWALLLIDTALQKAGHTLYEVAPRFGNELYLPGLIALSQGFLLSAMVLTAIFALGAQHKFRPAAWWCLAGALLSMGGLIHAYTLTPLGVQNKFGLAAAPEFALAYALTGLFLLMFKQAEEDEENAKYG